MSKFIKNFIHGFGSVLDIWPDSRHHHYYYRFHKSEADALSKNWKRVGGYLNNALPPVENEQEIEEEEKQITQ